MSEPYMGTYASGPPMGLSRSTGVDQSMRSRLFHCLFLPFSYRLSSLSRPSSYSHVKTVSPPPATCQRVCSTGRVYTRVLMWRSTPFGSGRVHVLINRLDVKPPLQLALHGAMVQHRQQLVGERQAAVDEVAKRLGVVAVEHRLDDARQLIGDESLYRVAVDGEGFDAENFVLGGAC